MIYDRRPGADFLRPGEGLGGCLTLTEIMSAKAGHGRNPRRDLTDWLN